MVFYLETSEVLINGDFAAAQNSSPIAKQIIIIINNFVRIRLSIVALEGTAILKLQVVDV